MDTVYRSGHLDANGDLMDHNSALRPDDDPDLTLFNGTLYKNGQESNVFELDSLVNTSLAPFETRTSHYAFTPPSAGVWNVRSRLLFRPFGPYLFRSLEAGQYAPALPVFEMLSRETTVAVD
jgi:hypothetical protein